MEKQLAESNPQAEKPARTGRDSKRGLQEASQQLACKEMLLERSGRHPACFRDLQRGLRSLAIGTAMTTASLRFIRPDDALLIGFLTAMVFDMGALSSVAFKLNADQTRNIFGQWKVSTVPLIQRTVLMAFISIGLMSLCIRDIYESSGLNLPTWTRMLLYFAALFVTWMELHTGFSIYYAKKYYQLNPQPSADGQDPQGFVFPGNEEPVFTDFLYLSYAVGLTYAMSDTNLEDSSVRRVVLIHSLVSFLFYSTVITAVLNLATSSNPS